MKKYLLASILLFFACTINAQPGKKTTAKEKAPTQSEMNKEMEEAMKGMSEEEKIEMRKMMKDMMPDLEKKPGSDALPFTDNKKLIPAKDQNRINSISKKIFTDADINTNAALLYSKLMSKIPTSEKAIINNVMSKTKKGSELMEAATTSFIQGHNQAAMALAMKAVQADPKNVNYQNNLAAILSQSGYPEKAIPYLKKLSAQLPGNSTVLHNLGFAWFSLGQIDTARRYFGYAAARNPNNPETGICRGLIEELRGDPKKAADHYVESFEHAPNPFTENLAKNVNAKDRLDKIDFDKLKTRMVIYEYFKKDWIIVPTLSDDVMGYENDRQIKNGFSKMFEELNKKIEEAGEASSAEVEALMEQGETTFAKTMMKETIKGINMMSMPAVYVQMILQAYLKNWNEDYAREITKLMDKIEAQKKVITKSGANDKCADMDRKNNEFLKYANPQIREFYTRKIEEFRVWLNAYCTWSWYIAGNPKNTILTTCISWTMALTEYYKLAVEEQYEIARSCVKQNSDGITVQKMPVIPNFTCPAVVSIPFGLDELKLSAEAINFDNNDWKIKQAAGMGIPNVTLSIGLDKNDITEPGKYGNPYIKTGNGSMSISGINYGESTDEQLTPLSKILDDLTPLSKLPLDELAPLDASLLDTKNKLTKKDIKKIRNAELTRKILKELMSVKCPGELPKKKRKEKFVVGLGELEMWDEFVVGLGELEMWDEEAKAWINSKGEIVYEDGFTVGLGELVLEDVETSGLQTVINNGLEVLGTVKNFIKGLFD